MNDMLFGPSQQNADMRDIRRIVRNLKVAGGKVELELDPEAVRDLQELAEESVEDAAAAEPASTRDLDIFVYVKQRKQHYAETDRPYDPAKHDAVVFKEAAVEFTIGEAEAREAYERGKRKFEAIGTE